MPSKYTAHNTDTGTKSTRRTMLAAKTNEALMLEGVGAFSVPKGDAVVSTRSEIECATEAAKSMSHTEAGSWTVAPDKSKWVQNWDVAICFALVYTALVTPAEVGFIHDGNQHTIGGGTGSVGAWAFFTCTQIVNLVFIGDVGLQFFLHYQDQQGTWVRNHARIVKKYLYGSFAIDFISSIPYGALTLAIPAVGDAQALRLLRLLRLAKLLRIIRSSRLVTRYRADMSISYGVIQLVGFVVLAVLFCHWMAFLWGFVGHFQVAMGAPADDEGGGGEDFPSNSWMGAFEKSGEGPFGYKWNIRNPKHQYRDRVLYLDDRYIRTRDLQVRHCVVLLHHDADDGRVRRCVGHNDPGVRRDDYHHVRGGLHVGLHHRRGDGGHHHARH